MMRFYLGFTWVTAMSLATHAHAVRCEAGDPAGAQSGASNGASPEKDCRVVVSDPDSKTIRVVRFLSISECGAALSKCRQLAEVHSCSKIGTDTVEIYGIGEHIQKFQRVDVYGHTLQNAFAQLFRSGWGQLNECKRDLVETIAGLIR